jgi:selenocysteine-specific elongation factor
MYVIGTAGHVDHGKSLLVEALTGIDPDRLREEKTRGMTIDLGFAWLTLPSGRTVSIVDVPGHERFIKNMLAGAGGVDLALLVVAADDGVMPQTREHLAILDLLGVSRGVVALTKRDLVDDAWLALIEADMVEALQGTTLEGSPVVACSARTRTGLDDLERALDAAIDGLPPKRDIGRPRLPIDRVFTIDGFGTVVTGTLIDGAFALGDEVEALPGGARGRIRGLQTHKDKVQRALPGTRTAVNIAGVRREDLRRGLVLARPASLLATNVIDARLRAVRPLAHPLRHGMRVTFHAGSDEANAQLRLLDADELRAGDEAWAQIKLGTAVAVIRGDRFVLRTPNDTVAGGVIVDASPKRHRRHHAPTIAALDALLSDDPERILLDAIARTPMIEALALRATLADDAARAELLAKLSQDRGVVEFADPRGSRYATTTFVDDAQRGITETLAAFHRRHPLRAGMPSEELRAKLSLDGAAAGALIEHMSGVCTAGALVALTAFAPSPSTAQQQTMDAYLSDLRAAPFSAPSAVPGREELQYLIDTGAVVDAGDGIVFEAGRFHAMSDQVRAHIRAEGAITLAQARDLLATNRRYAQALLEHLDRLRVTRRIGDRRILREGD